ncbi:histone chaperone domain CHZ-domain-containing protein [Geopyxis carbonaria]|nr:histone chaperone domain CHZ-domain-containing protein [Geopyxis carbonaria]
MSSSITEQQSAPTHTEDAPMDKGKGKAVEETDNDDSSDEEMGEENAEVVEEDEDELAEIDPSNIIESGRRTRGVSVDYAKAAAEEDMMDEDDDEDDDFKASEEMDDK